MENPVLSHHYCSSLSVAPLRLCEKISHLDKDTLKALSKLNTTDLAATTHENGVTQFGNH
jgi:hypothetical protein